MSILVGQVQSELEQMRDLYVKEAPKRVLEIGVLEGGTLREWLLNAAPNATVVAVDPAHQNPGLYEEWKKPDTNLIVGDGRSSELADLIREHGPYDWVFVDGDHEEGAVRFDVELALSVLAEDGLLLIHDIVAEGYPPTPPRIVYDELTVEGGGWEIVSEPVGYPENCGHGIGIVRV